MNKAVLAGTIVVATLLFANQAQAQCGVGVGISICGQIYVAPPPVVVPPPVVYAPPPPVYVPAPVVLTPPPVPVYVTTVQPAPVVVTQAPQVQLRQPRPFVRHRGFGFGVRGSAGYAGTSQVTMYGGGAAIRYITGPRFGVELTMDVFGGQGYAGAERTEFPITLNALWFVNPRSHFQLYILGGLGFSVANVEMNGAEDSPVYGGGQLGVGVEFLIGSHLGLTLDVRGFLRARMNERENTIAHDGSCRIGAGGEEECTNLEAGATFNAGFNFYL